LFAVVRWGEGENFFTGPSKRDRERTRERAIERERERPNDRRPTMNDDRFLLLLLLL